jgi:hypothetical protein
MDSIEHHLIDELNELEELMEELERLQAGKGNG